MIALSLSLLANLALVGAVGLAALKSATFTKPRPATTPPPPETIITIFAQPAKPQAVAEPAPSPKKHFARTSADQAAPAPEHPAFIGERDTRATSDRAPDAAAPPLPSQAGIDPKDKHDIETTESDYRDGRLSAQSAAPVAATPPAPAAPNTPSPPQETTAAKPSDLPGRDAENHLPPPREALLDGPHPVDVQVPRKTSPKDDIKPAPEKPATAAAPPAPSELAKQLSLPPPAAPRDPAFSGFQRKTAVTGSISRNGRSALDVADSPLGRYQAAISRAVEQEWQRNCVRHRDFITPGYLTVRFFVEPNGKVRSVQFVGDMETGEIQKGFTLNSIRDAAIPPMPRALRKDFEKEPLELVFRFYF